MARAFDFDAVKSALQTGIHEIIFIKRDGTLRTAVATTDMSLIPPDQHPLQGASAFNFETVTFYSMDDEGWRSFVFDNLLDIRRV